MPATNYPGWDEVFDVVVVGSGGGALTAALLAADGGASVLVIEKDEFIGGTTGGGGCIGPSVTMGYRAGRHLAAAPAGHGTGDTLRANGLTPGIRSPITE